VYPFFDDRHMMVRQMPAQLRFIVRGERQAQAITRAMAAP